MEFVMTTLFWLVGIGFVAFVVSVVQTSHDVDRERELVNDMKIGDKAWTSYMDKEG